MKCENFGCSQKCFSTPNGPECRCKQGYELSSDNKTCVDVNECEMDICAQNCTNTMGGFQCECYGPEYKLRHDRMSCKAVGKFWSANLPYPFYPFQVVDVSKVSWLNKCNPCLFISLCGILHSIMGTTERKECPYII